MEEELEKLAIQLKYERIYRKVLEKERTQFQYNIKQCLRHGEVRNGRISEKTQIQLTRTGAKYLNIPTDREHFILEKEEQGKVFIISLILFTYIYLFWGLNMSGFTSYSSCLLENIFSRHNDTCRLHCGLSSAQSAVNAMWYVYVDSLQENLVS